MSDVLEPALSLALKPAEDPEAYWAAVGEVRGREPSQLWAALAPLATSPDPALRALVPDVVRAMPTLAEQSIGVFRQMLPTEEDAGVLDAIAGAFTELKHPAVVELLLPISRHELP